MSFLDLVIFIKFEYFFFLIIKKYKANCINIIKKIIIIELLSMSLDTFFSNLT